MKKFVLPIVLALSSCYCYSQNLEKIAEIEVSSSTKVFTFKSLSGTPNNTSDIVNSSSLSNEQKKIVDHFLSLSGVSSAIYDRATNTFTVTSNTSTNITLPLNLN